MSRGQVSDNSTLESCITLLVYHLYGLTYDEVLIVDPEIPITREEYETLKKYLINLIFTLDKVQEKEYFSSNLNVDEYNKSETNQLVLSIKKCLVKGFKQTNEFSQSL